MTNLTMGKGYTLVIRDQDTNERGSAVYFEIMLDGDNLAMPCDESGGQPLLMLEAREFEDLRKRLQADVVVVK
jgi:hypothetical protein